MIPELGHFALIFALCFAILHSTIGLLGAWRAHAGWMRWAQALTYGQCAMVILSFCLLLFAFANNDFSVRYIAEHSNSALPLVYRMAALWGGHEGSLLLWLLLLSCWMLLLSLCTKALPLIVRARVLSVMGLISVGFTLFMLLTSNPFLRLLPEVPADGLDLNPLLQDPGLVVHPPMLYMGYVGFSVAFSFAIAALLTGEFTRAWASWIRVWTLAAWSFLTLGIVLGSWWAYYELGWGGWWFWDPVENASFMPWLVGTALVHSLVVSEKRDTFKRWTLLLAIVAFSLSLLGTFLVRSGVLTSVHAFATDPRRGAFILLFLSVVVGGGLTLYALRAQRLLTDNEPLSLASRETLLLGNNMLLVVSMLTVLLGTLYPLLLDSLNLGKISVGPAYFNTVFVPLVLILAGLMGLAPSSRWQGKRLLQKNKIHLGVFIACALIASIVAQIYGLLTQPLFIAGLTAGLWLASLTLIDAISRCQTQRQGGTGGLSSRYWGMVVAHVGVAIAIIGVTITSFTAIERDVRMHLGDAVSVGPYQFTFHAITPLQGPNYRGYRGEFRVVSQRGGAQLRLYPEKRMYTVQKMALSETAISPGLWRDLYVALGRPLENNTDWSVRVYYKPFVRWLWLGGLLVIAGALLAMRRRKGVRL